MITHSWNFGDATTATGATLSKTYSAVGVFTVTLTVTDNGGATNSATTTTAAISSPPPPGVALTDGAPSLSYDPISNRISTAGYQCDSAGNLTRGQAENGVWQRYQYDAANRLVAVMNDSSVVIVTNSYGADNGRLKSVENGVIRWYGWDGGQSIIEYSDNGTNLVWAKSYVYLGGRLLLTDEPTGRQYHHADRLGTRVVTNASGAKVSEQATLPFGTALGSPETTGTPGNRRFTSYDRSSVTKLDYAVNRSYASWQGRFTQVDPLGMGAVSIGNPQSLNLYGYVQNDPMNFVDPSGLLLICYFSYVDRAYVRYDGTLVNDLILVSEGCIEIGGNAGLTHIGIDGVGAATVVIPQRDPCDVRDIEVPPNVSVNANIAITQQMAKAFTTDRSLMGEPALPSFSQLGGMVPLAHWFYNQVRNAKGRVEDVKSGLSWDYKQLTPDHRYENFGNFNFGATAAATGIFDLRVAQNEAGRAQGAAGTTRRQFGHPGAPGLPSQGTPPYGDDPRDYTNVQRGFEYFQAGCQRRK